MTTYRARLMDAETGGEGIHDFEAADDLLTRSPMRVVRTFFERERRTELSDNVEDYELYAALKNKQHGVVTAMGALVVDGNELPFMLMISRRE